MRKKLLHIVLLLFVVIPLAAQNSGDKRCWVVVQLTNGQHLNYVVPGTMSIDWKTDSVRLISQHTSVALSRHQVKSYNFEYNNVIDAVDAPVANGDIKVTCLEQGLYNIEGLESNSSINIYASNGLQVGTAIANISGIARVDVRSQSPGVYLIHIAENHTLKILR